MRNYEEHDFEAAKKVVMKLFEEAMEYYNDENTFADLEAEYRIEAKVLKRVLKKAFNTEVEFKYKEEV